MNRSDICKKLSIFILTAAVAALTQNAMAGETPKAQPSVPGPSAEALAAKNQMLSKRGRLMQINAWLSQGILGETSDGLLALRGKSKASVEHAMKDENADREKMFKALSEKKATTVMAQRKLYADKRRKEAPKGSPIQGADGAWAVKA